MRAMVLSGQAPVESAPLLMKEVPDPEPGAGEILVRVEVCGVCRTDLHIAEGDLPAHRLPVIPGHEVVGRVERTGPGAGLFHAGDRVGVAWLHRTDGTCPYCRRGDENLCDAPSFTGYDVDGGYAETIVAPEHFVYRLPEAVPSWDAAPLLCAGIIGYRAFMRCNPVKGEPIGLYGFGASAHIVIQIARHWGCPVYVATRGEKHRRLASELGAEWVGDASDRPPVKLRSAILFAPAGDLVPVALQSLDKGGTLANAGIYTSPIPSLDYHADLFQEKDLRSVTANTREDGTELLKLAAAIPLRTHTEEFPLQDANEALRRLKHDGINGAAVLRVSDG